MEYTTRRRSYDPGLSFKHLAIVVESNPHYRQQLGRLIFTRQLMRVWFEESLELALELLLDKGDHIKWVIFDGTAALTSSEEKLAKFLAENRHVRARFVLITDLADPNWPGRHLTIVKREDLGVLMKMIGTS